MLFEGGGQEKGARDKTEETSISLFSISHALLRASRCWGFSTLYSGSWNARRTMQNLVQVKNTSPFWASIWQGNASNSFRKHTPLEWTYKGNFKGWRQETERWRVSEMLMKGHICEGIVGKRVTSLPKRYLNWNMSQEIARWERYKLHNGRTIHKCVFIIILISSNRRKSSQPFSKTQGRSRRNNLEHITESSLKLATVSPLDTSLFLHV